MEVGEKVQKIPWVNIILLLTTLVTTTLAGALQLGVDLTKSDLWTITLKGLPFSISLMFVLGIHELGHYFTAKRFGVEVTLPYFIPAPTLLGTFGAFIKMKSPVYTRDQLSLVAVMGPVTGFIAAIIVTLIGLKYSYLVPASAAKENMITLGDPLILKIMYKFYFPVQNGKELVLHPVAFAGWIGFFVTSLNLIPASQLDGGHILFAIMEKWHRQITLFVVFVLLILGIIGWEGWIVWGILILIIGTRHPPFLYYTGVTSKTKTISFIAILIFLLTFIPEPFKI